MQVSNGNTFVYGTGRMSTNKTIMTFECFITSCRPKLSVGLNPNETDFLRMSAFDQTTIAVYSEHNHKPEPDNKYKVVSLNKFRGLQSFTIV